MVAESINLPSETEIAQGQLLAAVTEGLRTIQAYRQTAQDLEQRAREESSAVSKLSAELGADKEWLVTTNEPVHVITQDHKNYQTSVFRARYIRPLEGGIEFLSENESERITIREQEFEISITPAEHTDSPPTQKPYQPTEVIQSHGDIL